jgi:hypothetical protein
MSGYYSISHFGSCVLIACSVSEIGYTMITESVIMAGTQPRIPKQFLDVPSQRLYYLSFSLLCQAIKLFNLLVPLHLLSLRILLLTPANSFYSTSSTASSSHNSISPV